MHLNKDIELKSTAKGEMVVRYASNLLKTFSQLFCLKFHNRVSQTIKRHEAQGINPRTVTDVMEKITNGGKMRKFKATKKKFKLS